jgi:hypothetical protein
MNTQPSWAIAVRTLVYPVMFSANPLDEVDRVLDQLINKATVQRDWHQVLVFIRSALESDSKLSEVISQKHSEEVIRAYLAAVAKALDSKLSS